MNKKTELALSKLNELLTCGNERVELSAAKELLSMLDDEEEKTETKVELEVTVKII